MRQTRVKETNDDQRSASTKRSRQNCLNFLFLCNPDPKSRNNVDIIKINQTLNQERFKKVLAPTLSRSYIKKCFQHEAQAQSFLIPFLIRSSVSFDMSIF